MHTCRCSGFGLGLFAGSVVLSRAPDEIRLDRKPNPHIAFGAGNHFCLGAFHARLIIRELIKQVSESVRKIIVLAETPHIERTADFERQIGYERLVVRFDS